MSRILVDEVRSHSGAGIVIPADPVTFGDKVTIMDGKSVSGDPDELFGTLTVGPVTTTFSGNPIFQHRTFVSNYGILVSEAWDNDSGFAAPGIQGHSAGGTFSSPTYPKNNQYLAVFVGEGYFPPSPPFIGVWRQGGNLAWEALGDWGPANGAGRLSCYVSNVDPDAVNSVIAWRTTAKDFKLFPDGNLTISEVLATDNNSFVIGPVVRTVTDLASTFHHRLRYSNYGQLVVEAYDNSSNISSPSFMGQLANGTFASPTYPTGPGSALVALRGLGWNEATSSWEPGGSILLDTSENWTASAHGGRLTIFLTASGATGVGTSVLSATTSGFEFAVSVHTPASASSAAGLRVPHGTAPSSPVDGDVWTTTAGMFVRINGQTKSVNLT